MRFRAFSLTLLLTIACPLAFASKASPDQRLTEAREKYRLGEFGSALKLYQALQKTNDPEAEAQGLYGEGMCWNLRGSGRDPGKAIAVYDALIAKYPAHPLAAWSALDRVRARTLGTPEAGDTARTIRLYEEVASQYPDTLAGQEAFVYVMGLRTTTDPKSEATARLATLDAFLAKYPKTPFRYLLAGYRAACFSTLGRHDERMAAMIESLNTRERDPANPNINNVATYWSIAYTAEFDVGDFTLAREYYHRLIKEYPKDQRVFAVRQALTRMDRVEAALKAGKPIPEDLVAPVPAPAPAPEGGKQ